MRRTLSNATCWLLSVVLLCTMSGCSTIKSSDVYNEDLQEKIRQEQFVEKGDHVIIHTLDKKKYEFKVTSVDESTIQGKDVSIQIDDIVAVQFKSISALKTAGLLGGIATFLGVVFLLAAFSYI